MSGNMLFKYPAIGLHKTEIRLFRLLPGETLAGVFSVHDLTRDPHFTALSYTWGPPHPTREIYIQGQNFTIRENLWQFLHSFRSNTDVWLWIDQICIDQTTINERNHQVGLMATIYQKAANVLVWLGSKADGSDEAIEAINSRASLTGRPESSQYGAPVQTLFQRPYWNRLWILQEVLMGHNILVLCGSQICNWKALEYLFLPTESDGEDYPAAIIEISTFASSLIEEKASFQGGAERRLSYMLETFAQLHCEDVRDRVYGLLSLVRQSGTIPVDYSKTAAEVFFTAVQKVVEDESYISLNGHFDISRHLRDCMALVDISDSEIFSFVEKELGKRRKITSFEMKESGFKLEVDFERDNSEAKCDFCSLFRNCWPKDSPGHNIQLKRDQSATLISGQADSGLIHAISISGSPGYPQLPNRDSDVLFNILQLWLQECDANHIGSQRALQLGIPTRLIDVGTTEYPRLRLLETPRNADHREHYRKYIALSRPWDISSKHSFFKTIKLNSDGSKQDVKTLQYSDLPTDFQGAVEITRKLGVRYLWIDDICISYDSRTNWAIESDGLEDIYSSAYCAISAHQSTDQQGGVWEGILPQDVTASPSPYQEVSYTCEHRDRGGLESVTSNPRGWYIEEFKSARRRISFTQSEILFRCRNGDRCGAVATQDHATKAEKEEAITTREGQYQDLYRQYSELTFSSMADRAVAIRGLEKRLAAEFVAFGYFGILSNSRRGGLFLSSLLWCRKQDDPMTPIDFEEGKMKVPTWSWLAYKGSIDYLLRRESPEIQWEEEDVCNLITKSSDKSNGTAGSSEGSVLRVRTRRFVESAEREGEYMIKYDSERTASSDGNGFHCVLIARTKRTAQSVERICYILVVARGKRTGEGERPMYERLGAGYILESYIEKDEHYTEGWLC
ncbi:hypothetical protein VTL71DRAFT_13142 [Oculimacula yallundae]|uniref:Heterokaryon incompatibility domain-containing protein n=1 Tax=Oculimacula yallundae TaxID=86028 RepID=A0ABR4CQ35_9HELO